MAPSIASRHTQTTAMKIQLTWLSQYDGPNPWANSPVVVAQLKTDALADANQIMRAIAALWTQTRLPAPTKSLTTSEASDGLQAMGDAAVQWALAALNEVRGHVLEAGAQKSDQGVVLWLEFHHPDISRMALQIGLQFLIRSMANPGHAFAHHELKQMWGLCRQHHPDFQARILMIGARARQVPYFKYLANTRFWQFGWGARSRVFFETASNADGGLGWQWQHNKVQSKALMHALGIPAPQHVLVNQLEELPTAIAEIGFPCVIKPLDSGSGKGVTANISSAEQAVHAFHLARPLSRQPLMLEQHLKGLDHRLMVIRGQLVAALERQPSFLIGDGVCTLQQLLDGLNAQRCENLTRSHYLRPIYADDKLHHHLLSMGLRLDDVVAAGHKVSLRSNANISTGGIATDVTDRLHPEVRAMAEQLALSSGLETVGLDYITTDISQSPQKSGGRFIEINGTPGMAVFIAAGWTEEKIAHLVLGDLPGRIPVTLHVISPAQLESTWAQLQNQTLSNHHASVCGNELRIGQFTMHVSLEHPWGTVHAALRNQVVHQLDIFCSTQDIMQHGLPLDQLAHLEIQDPKIPQAWRQVLEGALASHLAK
jgi:cyanophycin synthetase